MRRLLINNRNGGKYHRKNGMNRRIAAAAAPMQHCTSFLGAAATGTDFLLSGHHRHHPSPLRSQSYTTMTGARSISPHQHHHHVIQVRHKVFVSRHNEMRVSEEQILQQCANHGISQGDVRRTQSHVIIKECPFCDKPTHGKADNEYKLYVALGGGAYFCHRCGSKGSWYDFKMKLGGYEVVGIGGNGNGSTSSRGNQVSASSSSRLPSTMPCLPMPSQRLAAMYISKLMDTKTEHEHENNPVLEYLVNVRGLLKTTLRKYGVGRATYNFPSKQVNSANHLYVPAECVTFPWILTASQVAEQEDLRGASYEYTSEQETSNDDSTTSSSKDDEQVTDPSVTRRIKARAFNEKSWQRLDPPGGGWGLFGFHTVPKDATEIVITEGEYDAMAVYQGTGRPAVSLPNGCRSLPVEVLPLLERFETIYLWMDNDAPGQEGAEKFCKKIGRNRCFIVTPDSSSSARAPKDANEALLMGLDLNDFLDNAKQVPHERILTFEELRTQVLHEIMHPDKYVGVSVPSLPVFTSLIKGFRRGEVTVITGPTGSGKTTFLGQLSLDFAEQGVNTLWGSFEIKNTRLMHKLLQQFSREPLPVGKPESAESLNALADRFQNLPMYFMKFHGGSDVDDVLDAMDFAVYVNDVEHIILDNMQFMISRSTSSGGSSFDKFDVQDSAIEKFRKFATEHDVHVTLVCHPKKEEEGARLGINSVYGSAKATQEADTVLILQNDGRRKYIEVKKNRFDGTLGMSPLFFERKSGRYTEAPDVDPNQQQRTVKPIPVHSPAGGKRIQARALSSGPPRASSPPVSDEEIDNHWDSMLEDSRD